MVPSNCLLNHMLIPWVSEVIYYCDYLEFGNICMFLTCGPQNPEVDEDVRWDPPPRIIRPKERNVRLRSNMGYLSGQNPL